MLITSAIISLMLVTAWFLLARREPEAIRPALGRALGQTKLIGTRIPFALLFASFLAALLPPELVLVTVGADTGVVGVLVAAVVGILLPGGPFVSFPLAVGLAERGAGIAQLVTLVSAWSIVGLQRALVFELPLMGVRFTVVRSAVSVLLPVLAGFAVLWLTP